MALLFTDGFDYYTNLLSKWDTTVYVAVGSGTFIQPQIAAGTGRGGAGAFTCQGSQIGATTAQCYITKNLGSYATLYFGFALKFDPTIQAQDAVILKCVDGSTSQVELMISATGILFFRKGSTDGTGTILGTSSVALPANSYHYVEVQVTVNSGTSGSVSLRIDQTTVITATGINTSVSGNNWLNSIKLGCPINLTGVAQQGPALWFDDIYIDTSTFNGDVRINGQVPGGNGSTQNFANNIASWAASTAMTVGQTIQDSNGNLQRVVAVTGDAKTGTPTAPTWATSTGVNTTDNHVTWSCLGALSQYKLVNENTTPDGDYSYISSNNVGDISRFTFPAITGPTIKTVMIWANARKDDGGYRTIQGSVKSGATTVATGTDVPLGGNYQSLLLQQATDPATGVAWTSTGVNAAEFGVKLTN